MRGWRVKLIFFLIVYFAGFATAIYTLVPAPEPRVHKIGEEGFVYSAVKSDQLARSFSRGMHKCVDFGKDATWRTGAFLKQKIDERQLSRDG